VGAVFGAPLEFLVAAAWVLAGKLPLPRGWPALAWDDAKNPSACTDDRGGDVTWVDDIREASAWVVFVVPDPAPVPVSTGRGRSASVLCASERDDARLVGIFKEAVCGGGGGM